MDFKEAMTEEVTYQAKIRGITLFITLRNPTASEDLEYRRRSAKINVKNRQIDTTETALDAPLWLLNKIKTRAEYSNGSAERFVVDDDMWRVIPERAKLQIITRHLTELEGEEADSLGNSQRS